MEKKKVFAILLFFLVLAANAFATIDGFEDGDYTASPVWTRGYTDGGSVAVAAGAKKTGSYGLRLTTDGVNDSKNNSLENADESGTGHYYTWIRTSNVNGLSWYGLDTATPYIALLGIVGGKFTVTRGGAAYEFVTIPANNTWYRFGFDYNGGGAINAYIFDAENVLLERALNIPLYQNTGTVEKVYFQNRDSVAGAYTTDFDEAVYIAEDDFDVNAAPFILSPTVGQVFQTNNIDFNFYFPANCGLIDANIVNYAAGRDFNLLWEGQLDNNAMQAGDFFVYPQNGQQNITFNADCNSILRSADLNIILNLYDFNITAGGYTEYDGNKYITNLDYNINYRCGALEQEADLNSFLDDGLIETENLTCNAGNYLIAGNYAFTTSGFKNFKFGFDAPFSADNNTTLYDVNFIADLNAPEIIALDVNNSHGFFNSDDATTWMVCNDNESPVLFYEILQNDVNVMDINTMAGDLNTVDIDLAHGANEFVFTCTDLVGNFDVNTSSRDIYAKHFTLIDEDDRNAFDTGNTTKLIAYGLDSNTYYDFIAEGTDKVFYFTPTVEAIRFEFYYDNAGTEIQVNREFDVSLLDDLNINVCAPKLQTFYQQIFLSTSERGVIVVNDFADCYLMASKTRYVYSNVFSLSTYTIDKPYYLYIFSNGVKVLLALLEGSAATTKNLDMLIFESTPLDLTVTSDELEISKYIETSGVDTNSVEIYFRNNGAALDNVVLSVREGGVEIWNYTESSSPEEFLIYFNYTGMDINADILSLVLTKNYADGTSETITRMFTREGGSGILNPALAIVIALVILIFGLSMVSYKIAFGWFGIITGIIALAVLAFAVPVWYVQFFQAIIIILIVFIALGFNADTSKGVR